MLFHCLVPTPSRRRTRPPGRSREPRVGEPDGARDRVERLPAKQNEAEKHESSPPSRAGAERAFANPDVWPAGDETLGQLSRERES